MKLGIITDIHNNLLALKTVVEYFEKQHCDKIICCGDLIGIGPYPEETVQFISKLPNLIAVRGNHDDYLVKGMPTAIPNEEGMEYGEIQHHQWEHSLLSESSVDFLKKLPARQDILVENHKISVMHYCTDQEGKYVKYVPNPSEQDAEIMMADIDSEIVIVGHDHKRTIQKTENKWYINVGSLGCPGTDINIARAGILTLTEECVEVEPIELTYHVEEVVAEINRLCYPDAENIKKFFFGINVSE